MCSFKHRLALCYALKNEYRKISRKMKFRQRKNFSPYFIDFFHFFNKNHEANYFSTKSQNGLRCQLSQILSDVKAYFN